MIPPRALSPVPAFRWHDRCARHAWRAARQRRAIVALAVYALAQVLSWSELAGGLVAWLALVAWVTRPFERAGVAALALAADGYSVDPLLEPSPSHSSLATALFQRLTARAGSACPRAVRFRPSRFYSRDTLLNSL